MILIYIVGKIYVQKVTIYKYKYEHTTTHFMKPGEKKWARNETF